MAVGNAGSRPPAKRGPRGARVGDVVVAEGSRWRVEGLDLERREAICRLLGGSRAQRRFRARRILKVEREAANERADGHAVPARAPISAERRLP